MTVVIPVPPSLDENSFEQVLEQVAPLEPGTKLLLDARHARWASPYALTALLTLAQARGGRPTLAVPESEDVAGYWARMSFFQHADELFELHGSVPRRGGGGDSNVLLEITPIAGSEDVHQVVGRIQQKASQILQELNIEAKATIGFAMTLSEVCQNIVEHAGRGGWVAVQTYKWKQRLGGRRVVQIAVCDAGMGFRASLESTPGRQLDDRWDDAAALEEAVIRGSSRFRDRGRGQGLAGTRKYVGRWDGKLSVRSGTARIAIVPSWDDDQPLVEGLSPMQGSQVLVTIPEKLPAK